MDIGLDRHAFEFLVIFLYTRGLDAKRIIRQNDFFKLRSVLEWYPAANDVGGMFSSLTPVNATLVAFESTVFLSLLG